MFLDIACFFSEYNSKFDGIRGRQNGITSQKALQIWKVPSQHSPMICLQNLMDRSLVKVNDKGNLVMHDQLRDMGRQIVREASKYECRKQSRIWDKEEAKMVLFNEKVFISSSNVLEFLICLPWRLKQHYVKCCIHVSKSNSIHGNAYKLGMGSLN